MLPAQQFSWSNSGELSEYSGPEAIRAVGISGRTLFESSPESSTMSPDRDDDSGEPSPEDLATLPRSRNQLLEWVLIEGNRIVLTAIFTVGVFASILLCHELGIVAFSNDDSITRLASGMVAGSFSLVTLVVSVNQLILSQQFSPAGQFRKQFEGVMEFRRDAEAATSVPASPAAPTRLLELLSTNIRDRATALAESVAGHDDEQYRERIERYAHGVADSTREIDEILDGADETAFDALVAAVKYDNPWQLYAARHLRDDTPSLSEETDGAFEELIDALQLFKTAQAHFKTVYLQRELTRFSQLTVFTGLPSIAAAVFIILLYGGLGGPTIRLSYHPYVVSLLTSIVLVPVGLLAAYILRTATLTRRTVAVGPMILAKDPDLGPFDVSYGESE